MSQKNYVVPGNSVKHTSYYTIPKKERTNKPINKNDLNVIVNGILHGELVKFIVKERVIKISTQNIKVVNQIKLNAVGNIKVEGNASAETITISSPTIEGSGNITVTSVPSSNKIIVGSTGSNATSINGTTLPSLPTADGDYFLSYDAETDEFVYKSMSDIISSIVGAVQDALPKKKTQEFPITTTGQRSFTLENKIVTDSANVYLNGLIQPKSTYTISSATPTVITLTDEPSVGWNVTIVYEY